MDVKSFADFLEPWKKIISFVSVVFSLLFAVITYVTGEALYVIPALISALALLLAWLWWSKAKKPVESIPPNVGANTSPETRNVAARVSGRGRLKLSNSTVMNHSNVFDVTDDGSVEVDRSVIG